MLYGGMILLLVRVLSPLGSTANGRPGAHPAPAFQLQPSELAKVAMIVVLAAYLSAHRERARRAPLLVTLGLAALPMLLIQGQPDLGTNLVFGAILLTMVVVAGVRGRHLAALADRDPRRRDRGAARRPRGLPGGPAHGFTNPSRRLQGTTYNLDQSKTTIGSGGVTGKGLFEGTQTNLSLRARAAHRLHLHRGGGGARASWARARCSCSSPCWCGGSGERRRWPRTSRHPASASGCWP